MLVAGRFGGKPKYVVGALVIQFQIDATPSGHLPVGEQALLIVPQRAKRLTARRGITDSCFEFQTPSPMCPGVQSFDWHTGFRTIKPAILTQPWDLRLHQLEIAGRACDDGSNPGGHHGQGLINCIV